MTKTSFQMAKKSFKDTYWARRLEKVRHLQLLEELELIKEEIKKSRRPDMWRNAK